jgi:hypothetical protein
MRPYFWVYSLVPVLFILLLIFIKVKKIKMKNPKTTIFGLLAAISGYFATAGTGKIQVIAQAIAGISTFLLGGAAQDSKKDN